MKIDKKQKIVVTLIIALAIILVPVYFYVLADEDDKDANKIEVKNFSIVEIQDGSEPFDIDDETGDDSSIKNLRVRTFDSVKYILSYSLGAKDEDEDIDISTNDRKVILDVLIPIEVEAKVSTGASSDYKYLNDNTSKIEYNGSNYRYAEFVIDGQGVKNALSLTVTLDNIYSRNNQSFEPIFLMKESSDESVDSISDKCSNSNSCEINKSIESNAECGKRTPPSVEPDDEEDEEAVETQEETNSEDDSMSCVVTVTGKEKYSIKLFNGENLTIDSNKNKATYPVGLLVALDNQIINDDENKGIKGLLVPSKVSFSINVSGASSDEIKIENFANYKKTADQNPQTYKVYLDTEREFDSLNNGSASQNDNLITISNIKEKGKTTDDISWTLQDNNHDGYYYLTTDIFNVVYERKPYDYSNKEIEITTDKGGLVKVKNDYGFTLGTYSSIINLKNTPSSENEEYGAANFNYNQDFYIEDLFSYGGTGDGITNLTNYLKLDNTAIDIILNDDKLESKFSIVNGSASLDSVMFGFGEWNSDFFYIDPNVAGCPNIEDLSKVQLMNLYGGPCLKEKENLKWVKTFDDSSLDENYKQNGAIIVKTVVTGEQSKNNLVFTGTEAKLTLKAKIKDNYRLNGNTYQIVSNAIAYANGEKKYLGDESGTEHSKNPDSFIKSEINNDSITKNTNLCSTESCFISGDSILVSGVKVSKPTINYYRNGKETSNFYYFPIEMRISSSAIKHDTGANFTKADIYVDLPKYMEYIDYDNSDTAKTPVEVIPSAIDENYMTYHYVFTGDEVKNGEIRDLKVFSNISMDTVNGVTPKIYVTSDFTISKEIASQNNQKDIIDLSSVMPISYRMIQDQSITLYNGSNLTTQGSSAPSNIEKSGSYTYSMRAYNNSKSNGNALSYPNASLYYVVPYKGDSSYSDLSSKFESNSFNIKFNSSIPSGYTVYYTKDIPSYIINEEMNGTKAIVWTKWDNPTEEMEEITGFKIVKNDDFNANSYFIANEGISITVTPVNSEEGDIYYNVFHIIADKPINYDCSEADANCSTSDNKKLYYSSSRTLVSVYNRKITGFVFEDYDENGIYTSDESKLEDIPVSLYKIKGNLENADTNNPSTFVSDDDILIAETVTGSNGEYSFRGVSSGNYYVRYMYDNAKYIPTASNVVDTNISGSSSNNSKANALPNTNIAISNIITFSGKKLEFNDINFGLKIKKEFAVDIKKFITNVEVISDDKVESFDYNNATTVTLNVKNPKNAKLRVKYSFYVENVKYYPGYVGMVIDAIPDGMTFNPNLEENRDWTYYDNNVYYNGLSGTILLPNQKIPFNLVLEANLDRGGSYVNSVSIRNLTLMGDELPSYDFSSLNLNGGGE